MIRILHFLLSICCLPSVSLAADVIQTPKLYMAQSMENISLTCEHEDSNFDNKYWYRQKMGRDLVLMGYTTFKEKAIMENYFKDGRFIIHPEKAEKSILNISKVTVEDNALYYCASSKDSYAPPVFGSGTVLSILGKGEEQSPPKVKIFRPSKKEFRDHSLISLVCVANGFYPEHVQLQWTMNGEPRNGLYQNVAIKNQDGKSFSTSKRLTLTKSEYFNPDNTFKCEAGFIGNGTDASDEVPGETDCGVSKESYAMYINQGKISYIMVLFKSGLYALIVLAIIWRRKVLSGSS